MKPETARDERAVLAKASAQGAHERVSRGLPGKALATAKRLYGLDNQSLGKFIGVRGDKTIAKRLHARRLPPVESDRVWRLLRLWSEAEIALEADGPALRNWFRSPNVRLGGRVPIELIATEAGAHSVSSILAAIEYGLPV